MNGFHSSEIAPAMRNANPQKNHDFLAQAMLRDRNPGGEADWKERYADAFRELYVKDDRFRDLVNAELTDGILKKIQELLDTSIEQAA